MNVTLRYKEADKRALHRKIKQDKFIISINNDIISKTIKQTIQSTCHHTPNKKVSQFYRLTRRPFPTQETDEKGSIQAPDQYQRQVKNKYSFEASRLVQLNTHKHSFGKVQFNTHKHSIETSCSHLSTCHHSAEKRKRSGSVDNAAPHVQAQAHLEALQSKNSHYAIRWRNPASLAITKSIRVILGEWLMQLALELQVPKNAVYDAMHYLDKYVGLVPVSRQKYQVVGLSCLFLSCKLEMTAHPSINIFLQAIESTVTHSELTLLEQSIMFKLKFKLNPPTLYQYMVLLFYVLNHFLNETDPSFADCSPESELHKDVFWVLDGVHLQNDYKHFRNKQKVCLSLLYILVKKHRYQRANISMSKLHSELESMAATGSTEKVFEEFLSRAGGAFKIVDLKECIHSFKKWAKLDRSSVSLEQEGELLKRIILNP